jgi:hypothetical protein
MIQNRIVHYTYITNTWTYTFVTLCYTNFNLQKNAKVDNHPKKKNKLDASILLTRYHQDATAGHAKQN